MAASLGCSDPFRRAGRERASGSHGVMWHGPSALVPGKHQRRIHQAGVPDPGRVGSHGEEKRSLGDEGADGRDVSGRESFQILVVAVAHQFEVTPGSVPCPLV